MSSARELGLQTLACFTAEDDAHVSYAHEGLQVPSASSYMDVGLLVSLCKKYKVDLVHPGYGFLSESAEFCSQLEAAGITFIGPSSETMRHTGDKLSARQLAHICDVPVLPALTEAVDDIEVLRAFARDVDFPIMIKAVEGGGGRGIRLVHQESELESSFRRAVNESPSKQCFAEKAAVGGFRHVEVQILGDGLGNVRHLWERECSIQRRFQKVVEIAPSTVQDRHLINSVIDAALRMAKAIKFSSLGTWEFLVSPESSAFYFMEINPRLQVEHTITEAICGVDLVRWQIQLALGKSLFDLDLGSADPKALPPTSTAIQLRITAEDILHNFSVSIGRIRQVLFPGGQGVRVDSHLRPGVVISTNFDSLLAKLVVVACDWDAAVSKAERALQDVVVDGVQTNIDMLQRIVQSRGFRTRDVDTQWLETHLDELMKDARSLEHHANPSAFRNSDIEPKAGSAAAGLKSSDHLIRKGDRFNIQFEGQANSVQASTGAFFVQKVMRNDFPNSLALELAPSVPRKPSPGSGFKIQVSRLIDAQQGASYGHQGKVSSQADPFQLVCPMPGQLVEVLVDDGDHVAEGDAILIVRQMKMELEVRAHKTGIIQSLFDGEEGQAVVAGSVICSIVPGEREKL